jgi:hypothetical protein
MADHRFSMGSRQANLIRVLILFGPMMTALGLLALLFASAHAHGRREVPVQDVGRSVSIPTGYQRHLVMTDLPGGPVA